MPHFKIAHVKEQGQDMIIVPLDPKFGSATAKAQAATIADLQAHASVANIKGRVVPVWDAGRGRMGYVAPPEWQPFFNSLTLIQIATNLNKEISW